MPKVGQSKKKSTNKFSEDFVDPIQRWQCPKCGKVHQFDSKDGCHNEHCKFPGKLLKQ
jgi:hypothetical protein